jgi:hypothetical protein
VHSTRSSQAIFLYEAIYKKRNIEWLDSKWEREYLKNLLGKRIEGIDLKKSKNI